MADCFTNVVSLLSYHFRTRMASVRDYVRDYVSRLRGEESFVEPSFFWSEDLQMHSSGEFSFAVIQSNEEMKDYSQVEVGFNATFVGVYDGHGGKEAAHFIRENLFKNLAGRARQLRSNPNQIFSRDVLRDAILETDAAFLADVVENNFRATPMIGAMGSCCLIGVIWNGTLCIANLGDSRAVIGSMGRCRRMVAEQLSRDHSLENEEIRRELVSCHPNDDSIAVLARGAWRLKGTIRVSRSIGDAYLKDSKYALDASYPHFHLTEPITRPLITAEPHIVERALRLNDKFIIFASDGLWEHLTNQEAVEIVHRNPRTGIAKKLIKAALEAAAREHYLNYEELQQSGTGHTRRVIHDDITAIVIFLDHGPRLAVEELSYKGSAELTQPSAFTCIRLM